MSPKRGISRVALAHAAAADETDAAAVVGAGDGLGRFGGGQFTLHEPQRQSRCGRERGAVLEEGTA
jgi:hypothetical protein